MAILIESSTHYPIAPATLSEGKRGMLPPKPPTTFAGIGGVFPEDLNPVDGISDRIRQEVSSILENGFKP